MGDLRLRPTQWTLLERLAAIDDRLSSTAESGLIHIGMFNQGTSIVSPNVADPSVDEADLRALERAGVLNVVSQTSSLVRLRVAQLGFDALDAHRSTTDLALSQPPRRQYQVDPPGDIRDEAARWVAIGNQLQEAGQLTGAVEAYRRAWGTKLSGQPLGYRFHKGAELSWIASAYMQAGLLRESFRWWLAAFLEDAISRAEDSPTIEDELHWPAAQALRQLGIRESVLRGLSANTRRMARERAIQDPMVVFVAEGLDGLVEQVRERTGPPPPSVVRVFVSSPGDLRRERILVADVCRDLGIILQRDVRALLWEGAGPTHPESPPFAAEITGRGPQAVIDNQTRDGIGGYDVYVGMMWLRIGTPTGDWRSGTEAEFRYALDGFQREGRPRKVLFYTKRPIASQERAPEANDFIRELETALGLPQRFRTRPELRALLIHDLGAELRAM